MPLNGRERLCRFGSIFFFLLFALLTACDPPRDVSSAGTDSANQADSVAEASDRSPPGLRHCITGNPPVGGAGACSQLTVTDGTQSTQMAYVVFTPA
jgi:hypothetical protein